MGPVHTALAFAALGLSIAVCAARKGTRTHKRLGLGYAAAMFGLNVTALGIYELLGSFGPFHYAALASLATLLAGLWPLLRRRAGWLRLHAEFMSWSVVGLWAAAAAEAGTRLLPEGFWTVTVVSSAAIIALGWVVIRRTLPQILERFPARARG